MVICDAMKNAVNKRLDDGKDIDTIAGELCSGLKFPRKKIIGIVKELRGIDWMKENDETIKYSSKWIRNPLGTNKNRVKIFTLSPEQQTESYRRELFDLFKKIYKVNPNWEKITNKCIKDFKKSEYLKPPKELHYEVEPKLDTVIEPESDAVVNPEPVVEKKHKRMIVQE